MSEFIDTTPYVLWAKTVIDILLSMKISKNSARLRASITSTEEGIHIKTMTSLGCKFELFDKTTNAIEVGKTIIIELHDLIKLGNNKYKIPEINDNFVIFEKYSKKGKKISTLRMVYDTRPLDQIEIRDDYLHDLEITHQDISELLLNHTRSMTTKLADHNTGILFQLHNNELCAVSLDKTDTTLIYSKCKCNYNRTKKQFSIHAPESIYRYLIGTSTPTEPITFRIGNESMDIKVNVMGCDVYILLPLNKEVSKKRRIEDILDSYQIMQNIEPLAVITINEESSLRKAFQEVRTLSSSSQTIVQVDITLKPKKMVIEYSEIDHNKLSVDIPVTYSNDSIIGRKFKVYYSIENLLLNTNEPLSIKYTFEERVNILGLVVDRTNTSFISFITTEFIGNKEE